MIENHVYVVDIFKEIVSNTNKALVGEYDSDKNINGYIPITGSTPPDTDGVYLITKFSDNYANFGGLIAKNGDLLRVKSGIKYIENRVNYTYGHPIEVATILDSLSKSFLTAEKKYPLVILITDFKEQKDSENYYCKSFLDFLIVNATDPNYSAEQRTNESFKKILHPIYEEFIRQIDLHEAIIPYYNQKPPHTATDRYYLGRDGKIDQESLNRAGISGVKGNIFNDYLDAVEIKGLEIKIKTDYKNFKVK